MKKEEKFILKKQKVLDENMFKKDLRKFVKSKRKNKKTNKKTEDSVYKSNFYFKISNFFMENLSFNLIKKHPNFFESLFNALKSSNLKILSKTYVSLILFSCILSFPIFLVILFFVTSQILLTLVCSLLLSFGILYFIFYYPFLISKSREKIINQELVFAIVHMATVASSGAHPVKIFELIVRSKEYKEVEEEFKRILNYINLFGYSLSSSLKIVAKTTPSAKLKELLDGMVSTVETGGDMKKYLSDKSNDALLRFRLDQKKYLETIAAYSEVYVGVLIAAPLLFVVTLAILEKISSSIFGISMQLIAMLGTFIALPVLNILFILVLESTKQGI
jgi:archaeal flagellar protein FlaJ